MSWTTVLKERLRYEGNTGDSSTFIARVISSSPSLHSNHPKIEQLEVLYEIGKLADMLKLVGLDKSELLNAGKVFEDELLKMLKEVGAE